MAHHPRIRAPFPSASFPPAGVWAALVLCSGACQELPHHPGDRVQILEQGSLEALNPADVAVAPLEIVPEGLRVPSDLLREVVCEALVKRRYSPLALEFVDSRVVDASYRPGSLGEDAVCQVVVHAWNETKWETGRVIEADLELRLVDPRDPGGRPLWAARYPGSVDATSMENHVTEPVLYRWALSELVAELAGALPPRSTLPGRS